MEIKKIALIITGTIDISKIYLQNEIEIKKQIHNS